MQEDLVYKLALKEADGIGGVLFRHLISYFGTAKAVLESPEGKLLKTPGIGPGIISGIKKAKKGLPAAEKLLTDSIKKNFQIISFQDASYPQRFKGLYDAPPIIFCQGSKDLNYTRTVGIVGTRKATDYGKEVTENIVAELAEYGVAVISGLAYGIDVTAHKAALKNNLQTVAVMAGGFDFVYPAAHKKYVKDITENGALVTENKNDVKPIGPQFIARNRIIAALSDAVIIVESARRGGGLVTAEYGNNYHREVYAVPGAIGMTYSEGPNTLIRLNKAKILTSAKNIIGDLNWSLDGEPTYEQATSELDLTKFTDDESKVLSLFMQKGEIQIDDLSFETNIPLNKLASLLLNLEFQDLVKAMPGKKFKLK
ncbi:DNA-processing protein DprA [Arcticibacterium luteifluviistationis]|uniref:DNA-protecting protein DprA n=1 Tax=Arcticibacterium luteifluviistationis TaxID=1784714 RepID=A0A2Z4GCD1_9BACT|nr:DNA-processing protein DprA [Arcticibacterium luteifluviistationis]AWV98718.1 DNA-protecting protein DprA [Arcticibacterium luteifluviistationis]